MSELSAEFKKSYRDPAKHRFLKEEERCPKHKWNLRASSIERKSNNALHCFQCEFEDMMAPGNPMPKSVFPKDWITPTIDDIDIMEGMDDISPSDKKARKLLKNKE